MSPCPSHRKSRSSPAPRRASAQASQPRSVVLGTPSSAPRARSPPSDESDFLTVQGDIADVDTAERVVEQALGRFGRIDSLINNAGIFIGKPFTDYTPDDYAAITAVNLAGFFHITQRAIRADGHPGQRPRRQHQHQPRRPRRQHETLRAGGPHQRRAGGRDPLAGHRIRLTRGPGQRGRPRSHQDPRARPASYEGMAGLHPLAGWARSATSSTGSSTSNRPRSSPARSCTSTAVRPPDTDSSASTPDAVVGRLRE